jgi:hypothetical protein
MTMDPKDLKKRFEEKNASATASVAEATAEAEAQKYELEKRAEEGRAALRDVVVPYFAELEAAFPKGQFSFNPAARIDAKDQSSVAASFIVGNGPRYFVEVIRGNVRIFCEGPYFERSKGDNKPPIKYAKFIFVPSEEPFIEGPHDLTREKLGKLIQIAIDQC